MSFRLKTTLYVAIIQTVLLTTLLKIELTVLQEVYKEKLTANTSIMTRLLTTATKNAVLSNDLTLLNELVKTAVETPEIVYVRILGSEGVLVENGKTELLTRPSNTGQTTDDLLNTITNVTDNGITQGRIEIGLSVAAFSEKIQSEQIVIVSVAGISLLLTVLLTFLLGTRLTRQLLELQNATHLVATGGIGVQVDIKSNDEVGKMAAAFNLMSERLQQTYEEFMQSLVKSNQMAKELSNSEQFLRTIMNNMLDGVITIDEQGIILTFNLAAERMFGYQAQAVINQNINVLMPEPHRHQHFQYIHRYLKTQKVNIIGSSREMVALRRDGSEFPMELSVNKITLETGNLFVGLIRDITARKQAEEKLRQLSRAVEQSPNTIVITDAKGSIEFVNPAFCKITGYSAEEAIGNNPRVLKSGKHSPELYEKLWTTISRGDVWQGELINRRKNGELYWEAATIAPVKDHQGEITHYIAIKEDITRRKNVEQQLQQSELKFRTLFESTSDAIILLDAESFLDCNNATLTMFACENKQQFTALHLADISPTVQPNGNDSLTLSAKYLQQVLAQGSHHFEWLYRRHDNTCFPAEVLLNAMELDGRILLQAVIRDITQRKLAEEEIRRAHAEIVLLNQRLQKENLRMSAELEVTRSLQHLILPRQEELQQIDGLEIASFMQPAGEVGGDYYDVLKQEGKIRIAIGDVTGHGLESGMLMLMVQTAVRTLLNTEAMAPSKTLTIVNRTIYDNVQRMNSDKNLSLALLDYHQGVLTLSGQHEQIIVMRGTDLEVVDTLNLGFPIGLEENIAEWIGEETINLNPGDVVVLYTDGITEGIDPDKKLYGLKRLCQVIRNCALLSAEEICKAVIEDWYQFVGTQNIFDDITLLVLKQKN